MAKHVWINPDRFKNASKMMRVDGIDLTVQLSPYDCPQAISGSYQKGTGDFVISFNYIDEEPMSSKPCRIGDIEIVEGKYTGKLLKIMVPVDKKSLKDISIIKLQTRVLDAFEKRRAEFKGMPTVAKELNQEAAKEILTEDFADLTDEFVCA